MSETVAGMMTEVARLIAYDLVFAFCLLVGVLLISAFRVAAFAVLKRNFRSYFSNPTGYVFLCLFVALAALAAFWPNEFFTSNLANLDQLNKYFPFIMLVFIPAITMGIWAEERRQGTDELLLTLPALDIDIVLGKYLAAASTFTVSLIFSQLANFFVLLTLAEGNIDTGMYFTTYLGYWFIGMAMLAVGMVASFLTNNLTVGFILGAMFNAPMVFAVYANVIIPDRMRPTLFTRWSFADRFDDFGRGVVSLSSMSYFIMVICLGVYLSLVFMGRRHWLGGRDGTSMLGHFFIRALAMVAILFGVNIFFANNDVLRIDTTEGKASSLSPDTKRLLSELSKNSTQPITVEAFISARVPEEYIKTRYNLISMLKELQRYGGNKIKLEMHDNLEEFSPEAVLAEERYGIRRQIVTSQSRGEIRQEQIIMGAAFTSGLERVVVPFFSSGVPVEFEIVRAASTASTAKRKKLGIVKTDVELNGGFSFAGGMPRQIPKAMLLEDLQRQYRTEDIDLSTPLQVLDSEGNLRYDAILVVQPSSLGPQQIMNLVQAVTDGQPAVIFEDPMPQFFESVVGTADDKPAPGGMFGGGAPPTPKGDTLKQLWKALGIDAVGNAKIQGKLPGNVVCQRYLPYPRFRDQVPPIGPLVFVGGEGGTFNAEEPAVKNFQEVFFAFPGGIQKSADSKLKFSPLAETSDVQTSLIDAAAFREAVRSGDMVDLQARTTNRNNSFTLAAWIRGKEEDVEEEKKEESSDSKKSEEGEKSEEKKDEKKPAAKKHPINVVYVCDIDILGNQFVELRNTPPAGENFRWNNVPFVLNLIDGVAGDDRFLSIRQRETRYFTLRKLEDVALRADEKQNDAIEKFKKEYDEAVKAEDDEVAKLQEELQKFQEDLGKRQQAGEAVDLNEQIARMRSIQLKAAVRQSAAEVKKKQLQLDLNKRREEIRRQRDLTIQNRQSEVKLWAALLPPIPPLLVGFLVYARRLLREREGMSRKRMR